MKTKIYSILLIIFFAGCSGMPIGSPEPITPQQIEAGLQAIKTGAQPIAWVFAKGNTEVVIWPGATDGVTRLWNLVCTQGCLFGWQEDAIRASAGQGYASTGEWMSRFEQQLVRAGWDKIPFAASSAAKWAGQAAQVGANALTTMPGFILTEPVLRELEEGPKS